MIDRQSIAVHAFVSRVYVWFYNTATNNINICIGKVLTAIDMLTTI